jgi:hypothetical protein
VHTSQEKDHGNNAFAFSKQHKETILKQSATLLLEHNAPQPPKSRHSSHSPNAWGCQSLGLLLPAPNQQPGKVLQLGRVHLLKQTLGEQKVLWNLQRGRGKPAGK